MIRVKNLWKRFGSNQVLKGLNLDIASGETLVILGRSGVGKSVLLKHIIGIEQPDEGTVEVDGINISSLKGHKLYDSVKEMGMLFQGAALFDSMTVGENAAFYLKQHGNPKDGSILDQLEINKMVANALEMVDLKGTESRMPSDLSGGMRKRAALARLIVYRPRLLLYDEPTTGLDPITAMQINDLIVNTQRELNATSIVVTHDLCSAFRVADRIAFHHDGKIKYIETPEDFVKIDDSLVQTFLENSMPKTPLR